MYGKVFSACIQGIAAQLITVEVDICNGLPQINLVGLPDSAVRESIERVRSAIKNCGFIFPMERITVNLAPADVRKEGTCYDLAIALSILIASGQMMPDSFINTLIIGELSLNGTLRPINGVLSMVHAAKSLGMKNVLLPEGNAEEATFIPDIKVFPLNNLNELIKCQNHIINGIEYLVHSPSTATSIDDSSVDYSDVIGQHHAKRALMIAAAGNHNILFIGPPGSGKTMLMRRLPTILPLMQDDESLEVTQIYSVAGLLTGEKQCMRVRPFRSPHHTISMGGLIGGGSIPKPGEISLAHRGVLFLDELPEFSRHVLEVLRQPLEDRHVIIARARATYHFPAHIIFAASMNPCPCGYFGSETSTHPCSCSPLKIAHYRAKISGPLLDRIDMHVELPKMDYKTLALRKNALSSNEMIKPILIAQHYQNQRYAKHPIQRNSELSGRLLHNICELKPDAEKLLKQAFDMLGFSARAHDRILKISRTIADLAESDCIEGEHLAEAIQYRQLDKKI